jgi:hypothetical protein
VVLKWETKSTNKKVEIVRTVQHKVEMVDAVQKTEETIVEEKQSGLSKNANRNALLNECVKKGSEDIRIKQEVKKEPPDTVDAND